MTKPSATVRRIGCIDTLTQRYAFLSNGEILQSQGDAERWRDSGLCEVVIHLCGDGWNRFGEVESGIDPVEYFQRWQRAYTEKLAANPAFAAFRTMLHEYRLSERWLIKATLDALGDDADISATLSDADYEDFSDLIEVTPCDLRNLHTAYVAMQRECAARGSEQVPETSSSVYIINDLDQVFPGHDT